MTTPTEEPIRVGQIEIRFLADGHASGGAATLFEFDVPAGARVPAAHSHDRYEETIYGVRGALHWTVEGTGTEVGPGEVLVVPRGAAHRFDNRGDVDATALAIVTPPALRPAYFHEFAAILDAAGGGPPDAAAVAAVMGRHGLTPRP